MYWLIQAYWLAVADLLTAPPVSKPPAEIDTHSTPCDVVNLAAYRRARKS